MTGPSMRILDVLGVGLDTTALPPAARALIEQAQVVAGGVRLLDALDIAPERRLAFTRMDEFVARLRALAATQHICIVADGDPLLWGIGSSLLRYFARHELRFHPQVSAMQTAAARLGLPWADCVTVSLHGRADAAPLFAALTHHRLVAVLTDPAHSPEHLARVLTARGVCGWTMHVAEALSQPEEQITSFAPDNLEQACARSWHALNLVMLEQTAPAHSPLTLGLDDDSLDHQCGLLTKQPVRSLALSCLRLTTDARLWDLGAGSAAVSIEAAGLIRTGEIIAIERHAQRIADIRTNVARHGAWLVRPHHASIEDFVESEPERPTHIFFGGGATPETVRRCCHALQPGGRMVIVAVLLTTLEMSRHVLAPWPLRIHQLHHAQTQPLGADVRFVPDNPVFLIEACKPKACA